MVVGGKFVVGRREGFHWLFPRDLVGHFLRDSICCSKGSQWAIEQSDLIGWGNLSLKPLSQEFLVPAGEKAVAVEAAGSINRDRRRF